MKTDIDDFDLIHSAKTLRKAVGLTGMLLPLALLLGGILCCHDKCIQHSLSRYYYTCIRDLFVGAICAIALFLFFYRGYISDKMGKWDKWASNIAGLCAVSVAWIPRGGDGLC